MVRRQGQETLKASHAPWRTRSHQVSFEKQPWKIERVLIWWYCCYIGTPPQPHATTAPPTHNGGSTTLVRSALGLVRSRSYIKSMCGKQVVVSMVPRTRMPCSLFSEAAPPWQVWTIATMNTSKNTKPRSPDLGKTMAAMQIYILEVKDYSIIVPSFGRLKFPA